MTRVGARGYSLDLRTRVVAAVHGGQTVDEAALTYSMHVETVKRYLLAAEQGVLDVVRKPTGRPPRLTAMHDAQLLKQLD